MLTSISCKLTIANNKSNIVSMLSMVWCKKTPQQYRPREETKWEKNLTFFEMKGIFFFLNVAIEAIVVAMDQYKIW